MKQKTSEQIIGLKPRTYQRYITLLDVRSMLITAMKEHASDESPVALNTINEIWDKVTEALDSLKA